MDLTEKEYIITMPANVRRQPFIMVFQSWYPPVLKSKFIEEWRAMILKPAIRGKNMTGRALLSNSTV